MSYELKTVKGYDFYEVSSALQKSIRRADVETAGYFALELWHSGYAAYVWKRLFTISAEDCYGIITKEIEALWQGYMLVNEKSPTPKGRIFISKAVIILCMSKKNRDADHLQNFIYDKDMAKIDEALAEANKEVKLIPAYTYDVHTQRGKKMGKTKKEFFKEEFEALKPRQAGLFDNLV